MSLELLSPESEQLYMSLKGVIIENAEKVSLTFDALARIHEDRLYRAEFKTFDAFCASVGLHRRRAYRMLEDRTKPKRIAAVVKRGLITQSSEPATEQEPEPARPGDPMTATEIVRSMSTPVVPKIDMTDRLQAMMEKLSIRPVIEVGAEACTPSAQVEFQEERLEWPDVIGASGNSVSPVELQQWKDTVVADLDAQAAVRALKAWAEKRRTENDPMSNDDAAWADYIAKEMMK